MHTSLSILQILTFFSVWVGLDGVKAVCGHEVDWKPMLFLTFFVAGLVAMPFAMIYLPKYLAP